MDSANFYLQAEICFKLIELCICVLKILFILLSILRMNSSLNLILIIWLIRVVD